jgi:hypothetical protein
MSLTSIPMLCVMGLGGLRHARARGRVVELRHDTVIDVRDMTPNIEVRDMTPNDTTQI